MPALFGLAGAVALIALGAFALALLSNSLVRALAPSRSGVAGFLIKVTTAPLTATVQLARKIVSVMGKAGYEPQQHVGTALHETARLADGLEGFILSQSATSVRIAEAVAGTLTASDLAAERAALKNRVTGAVQDVRGIGNDVLDQLDAVRRGIGSDVLPEIRSLDKELAHVLGKDLPAIRAREKALEHGAIHTWKWIRTHPLSLATGAFAGAVTIALGRIGAGWVRCSNWNKIGRTVCATPGSDIDALLGLLLTAAAIADYQELVKIAQGIEKPVAEGLQVLLKV